MGGVNHHNISDFSNSEALLDEGPTPSATSLNKVPIPPLKLTLAQ